MAKNNIDTVGKVKEQISRFISDREREIGEIDQHIASATADKAAAEANLRTAIETTNQDDYNRAKIAISAATSVIEMYSARRKQLVNKDFISERESDAVIDSILEYEKELAKSFKSAAAVHLRKLADLRDEYLKTVMDAENTLLVWQTDIHANYKTRGGTMFFDDLTGTYTDRSPKPVPVRFAAYVGCREAQELGEYLEKAKAIYEG